MQPRELEPRYLAALSNEIRAHEWEWTPETVYLGGGTPGSLDGMGLGQILSALPGRPWREATMEAAPGLFDRKRIDAWIANGIDRVSLGVQSFNQHELARTGRKHTPEIVIRDIANLRAAGIANINVDLIAGLPGQTAASWAQSLAAAAALEVPHLSVYMLEVDEDSRLGSEILLGGKRYGAMDVPDDAQTAAFYEEAVDYFAGHGIDRYEISNFARPGFESLHNLKYWRREPYIGFGSDAHSFDGTWRWQNAEAAIDYTARSERGESTREETTAADASEEKFFVGLRLTEGITPDRAEWQRHGAVIERFLSTGLLERVGERLRLTRRGIMVSNDVFQEFLTA